MSFSVSVVRWDGERAQHLHGAWESMPGDGLLWVWINAEGFRHRLLGADGYWISGDQYGCTYEDAQPIYGGVPFMAWEVVGGQMQVVGVVPPPEGARVLLGQGLPDDLWHRILEEHN